MTDPNPVVAALLASGRRALAPIDPKDTAVSHADDPQPPMPAEGAPYAYVVVERTFSPYADRFECRRDAIVIPEWDHKELEFWRRDRKGFALIPIGPDGDTGTRAIVEPHVINDPAELDRVPVYTIGTVGEGVAVQRWPDGWNVNGQHAHERSGSDELIEECGPVTIVYVPTEEASRDA